ncbi:MAG: histone deacetylase family protein [Thermoplasmatota archaeon]
MSGESSGGVPIFYHPLYESHVQPVGHPEGPERVKGIMGKIADLGIPVDLRTSVDSTVPDITAVHSVEHFEKVRDFGVGYMDPDTYHDDFTYGYAMKAAGGTIMAAEAAADEMRPTFSFPRPPGHHAGRNYNMGFCYFNNLAIAAKKLMRNRLEIEKIAILDIDAHHGNGTNDIFISDPSILYVSVHQWGIFPGTGHENEVGYGEGEGRTVNLPFYSGTGDPTYMETWGEIVRPILTQFRPDMIMVSLGGDAHLMDPLTSLALSTPGYHDLLRDMIDYARESAAGRITFTLEGGYHIDALSEIVAGAVNIAAGDPVDIKPRFTRTRETVPNKMRISEFVDVQSRYWKL